MKYIDSLREGMRISEVYLCKSKQIAQTKAGKDYGNLVLQDKTGTIDSKIWDLGSPGICNFEAMEYIPADYLPVSTKDIPKMYEELVGYVKSIKNPYLNKLAAGYFVDDPAFAKAFQFHSAAKSVHHGFVGGLLEHTLSVVKMCDYFAGFYKEINRDLLLTAAMFHDIGKTKELSVFPENDYTDDGQLLGHIIIGTEMVSDRIRQIPDFPEKLAVELKHCILAHHGELEYGSPKKPALLEAMALNLADNADAKMETMIEVLRAAGNNQGWLGYNRLLETNIRKTTEI